VSASQSKGRGAARTVVGVTFDQWGAAGTYSIDPARVHAVTGSVVVVESSRGMRLGRVTSPPHEVGKAGGGRIRRVVRIARAGDLDAHEAALRREPEAFRLALTLARERRLPLKLLRVLLDGVAGRATFFVAAPEKIDLGDLADALSRRLKLKVDVRQLGMRDVAKTVGGLGRCGRELCCSTFLTQYPHTSIRMAKDQNMALNDDRTGGVCGRTLCCLAYEHAFYKARRRFLPKLGKRAKTSDGTLEGKVIGVDVMRMTFTLLDERHNRHRLEAKSWERNVDQEVPEPEFALRPAQPASPPIPPPPAPKPRSSRPRGREAVRPEGSPSKKRSRRRRRRPKKDRDS
jgi:cell fate regulator YaaT (PSP1 superfamily)